MNNTPITKEETKSTINIEEKVTDFGKKHEEEQSSIIVYDIASMKEENRITLANYVKYCLGKGEEIPILNLNPNKYEDEIKSVFGEINFMVFIKKGTVEEKVLINDDFFETNATLISEIAKTYISKNLEKKIENQTVQYSEEDGI